MFGSRLWKSMGHAVRGIGLLLRTERNARIHAGAALVVLALGLYLRLRAPEWAVVVLAATAVLCAEAFNTALERLADAAAPERHPLIGDAKDLAAGAVLLAALGAALVGASVFGPRLLDLLD